MSLGSPRAESRRPMGQYLAPRASAVACDACGARHLSLCTVLDDAQLASLANLVQHVCLPENAVLMEEGEPASYVYNVNAGSIRLFKSLADGRRQIIGFAGPGHFLGLAAADHYVVSAETMEPVKLCRFTRATLRAACAQYPALERRLLDVTLAELDHSHDRMLLLGRKTAMERIASFLLLWAKRQANAPASTLPCPKLMLPLSRMDLADYLGLTIETVSRCLSQLKRDGLIAIPNIHEIILLRPQALASLADAVF